MDKTVARRPPPGEADERGIRCVVGGFARMHRGSTPRASIPRLDRITVQRVGAALDDLGGGGGEDVASVYGVAAVRLVAAGDRDVRRDDDVRDGERAGAPEVACLVHHAVPRAIIRRKNAGVVAEVLDRSFQRLADAATVVVAAEIDVGAVAGSPGAGLRAGISGHRRWHFKTGEDRSLLGVAQSRDVVEGRGG